MILQMVLTGIMVFCGVGVGYVLWELQQGPTDLGLSLIASHDSPSEGDIENDDPDRTADQAAE